MRASVIVLLGVTGLVAGCGERSVATPDSGGRGRFAGIGVYDAGPIWRHMTASEPKAAALARLADDEHVIAVVDSRTGEVRQCGDHSGYCVGMNPWTGAQPARLPASLTKHAAALEAEAKGTAP